MIVSVQSIKILLRKMILLLVLLSCKLQCDDFSCGQVRSFSLSKNRSFKKELDVQITSATMLFFDWLVSIQILRRLQWCVVTHIHLCCVTAFSKIPKLVMISMGRAPYTGCSVGGRGGGGYKTLFRGKGAVWLQNRF